jgi:hypothetical protein
LALLVLESQAPTICINDLYLPSISSTQWVLLKGANIFALIVDMDCVEKPKVSTPLKIEAS